MSWWRHCDAVVPAQLHLESCPPCPGHVRAWGHPQSGFKSDKPHATGFSHDKYQQVSPAFPLLPQVLNMCPFSPCQREGKVVWTLKYQQCLRSQSDGYGRGAGPELTPSHTRSPLLTLEVPTGHPLVLSAVRGACHQLPWTPHSCRSPWPWDSFWGKTSPGLPDSGRAGLHERERLQAFLSQLDCFCVLVFFFPQLFSSRDASLQVGASFGPTDRAAGALRLHEALHEMPIFLGWGENWAEISAFLRKPSCCHTATRCALVTQGEILLFPAVRGGFLSLCPTVGMGGCFRPFGPFIEEGKKSLLVG